MMTKMLRDQKREIEKSKEKRDMLEQVKQFRKGKSDKIDFLDEIEATSKGPKGKGKQSQHQPQRFDKNKGYVLSMFASSLPLYQDKVQPKFCFFTFISTEIGCCNSAWTKSIKTSVVSLILYVRKHINESVLSSRATHTW